MAGDSRSLGTLICRHWSSLPNERWTGDCHDVTLDVPVLMVANTDDPVTPILSERRSQAEIVGSNAVLLEQRSCGHCSISISSVNSCTFAVVMGYLLDGVVPGMGKVCEAHDGDW